MEGHPKVLTGSIGAMRTAVFICRCTSIIHGPADGLAASAISADPGRDIMIHGLPNGFTADQIGHPSVDWTSGCIAVTNAEIEEIWRLVDDGTAVLILPD